MLQVVKDHLREAGIRCHVISGQIPVKERTPIVEDFNNNPKGPKVGACSSFRRLVVRK